MSGRSRATRAAVTSFVLAQLMALSLSVHAADEVKSADEGLREVPITERDRAWWAYRPLRTSAPPSVKRESWVATAIDRFVLAPLEAEGIEPNAIAGSTALVRRLYLDVIGVPPSPDVVAHAASRLRDEQGDFSWDEWGKIVDRVLSDPRRGERWARHWLDVARFAESHGFEHDYDRNFAYHYRDFVIRAINADMPYDQFSRWQLAGDEIAPGDPEAMRATGFLGAGVFPTQITKREVERTRYDALDDMASTTTLAMLGLNVGCARCHDHKFDPIPARDYYRFLSTFTTTVRSEVEVPVPDPALQKKVSQWKATQNALVEKVAQFDREELDGRFETWLRERAAKPLGASNWETLNVAEARSRGGATLRVQPDASILATGKNPTHDSYTFVATTDLKSITAVRLEALADKSMVRNGPGRADNGNFCLTRFRLLAAPANGKGEPVEVALHDPRATFEQSSSLSAASSLRGQGGGWAVDPQFGKNHAAVFHARTAFGFEGGTRLTFTLVFECNTGHNIGRARLSASSAPAPVSLENQGLSGEIARAIQVFAKDGNLASLSEKQRNAALAWYRNHDVERRKLELARAEHAKAKPKSTRVKMQVTTEGRKAMRHHSQGADFFRDTYFLQRGDTEKKAGVAKQGFLRVLVRHPDGWSHWERKAPDGSSTSYRRRSLAAWITDVEYGAGHLLARVFANRVWMHLMGKGIVATPNDFGVQGGRPTHPELLDWLARDFIASGFSLSHLQRTILSSRSYLLSSAFDPSKAKIDRENEGYWRRVPRRLEAESIRDSLLHVSGALDTRMYGPGERSESMRRRAVYFFVKRSSINPMMQLFDYPEPLVSQGDRPSTTIAPQALLLMNSPYVRSWTSAFARRVLAESGSGGEWMPRAIRRAFLLALSREPKPEELSKVASFLTAQLTSYESRGVKNSRELAFGDFCQVVLSSNEFVYVD